MQALHAAARARNRTPAMRTIAENHHPSPRTPCQTSPGSARHRTTAKSAAPATTLRRPAALNAARRGCSATASSYLSGGLRPARPPHALLGSAGLRRVPRRSRFAAEVGPDPPTLLLNGGDPCTPPSSLRYARSSRLAPLRSPARGGPRPRSAPAGALRALEAFTSGLRLDGALHARSHTNLHIISG